MIVATANAGLHALRFSDVAQPSVVDPENCLLLTLALLSRNALTAITVAALFLLFFRQYLV